ncbi:MAG: hypothetical protein L6R42_000471 [Xanthoria sp. 1 TBL-2021]|nr:MAG: hypothetical protein L6R42_000471 [Xanthoria sp. 1 TBL-2021]
MGYDNKLYSLSPDTSIVKHRLHSPNDVLRTSSGNEQNYGNRRRAAVPKTEDDDDAWSVECRSGRSTHSHSAQAAIKQQMRKARRIKRDTTNDYWEGLRPAELESDRYLAYRAKQRQKAKDRPDENNVWPDFLENAFQLALRVVPPVGRKKENVICEDRAKLCGRNELISHKIEFWTGVYRSRKQVSSHIQVLKNFMLDNDAWLQHVNAKRASSPGLAAPQLHLQGLNLENLSTEDYRSLVHNPYGPIGPSVHKRALLCPPPNAILGSNAPDRGPRLNRIQFDMYVQSPAKEKIHRCTSIQAEIGASPQALEEISNWRVSFPRLEGYHERGELEDNIILIDSNIDLPPDLPPKNSTLSIQFKVNIAGAPGKQQWSTSTNYYENNGEPVDMRKFYEINNIRKTTSWDTPTVFATPDSRDIQLEIPLHSIWWVQLFTKMASRKNGTMHNPYSLQQEEEWSRRYLQEMSIMQEVRVSSGAAGASTRRVAIILWRFSPTRHGEVATTSWRKLKAPPQRFKVNSPTQSPEPLLQHSMVLDSSLQTIAMPQPVFAYAGRFLHQQSDIFVKDSERIVSESQSAQESPAPALSPDYTTSFPSSTTTSFPPSVTHGYLSHEESQESTCYSQDNCLYRQESFASENSFNFPQKATYALQEARAYEEDLNHLPGSLELESQDPAYYSQQSLDPVPDFHSPIQYDEELCQDGLHYGGSNIPHEFSGDQIQLSFQTHPLAPESHSPYIEPPPGIAHYERPVQTDRRFSYHEFPAPIEDISADHAETHLMATNLPQNEDLDFSAWDVEFTPEDLAALRSHNDGFHIHSNIQYAHGDPHHIDGHTGNVHTESDWTIIQMKNHLHETVDQGVTIGEMEDDNLLAEEIHDDGDNAGDNFGFEEIYAPESQLIGSQAVEGQQQQHVGGGLEHDYEGHDLQEDHL